MVPNFRISNLFWNSLALFMLSGVSAIPVANKGDPIVVRETMMITSSGRLIGHPSPSKSNVIEYLGVPYAEPPVGKLRFSAPEALLSNKTYLANQQPFDCPYVAQSWGTVPGEPLETAPRIMAQESADGYNAMSEDCLKLNIWMPTDGARSKAVMAFLYGGGFNRGSINNPAYNGAYMAANQDVIVVAFNYRVNIFGFANAPGSDTNVGLRDIHLAMTWIHDNIASFGGDISKITMFGQSQGADLISYYNFAYPEDGIVSSMIQESGSAFAPIAQNRTAKVDIWRKAAASVGCEMTDDSSVLHCMQQQNVSSILTAWSSVQPSDPESALPFGPSVDEQLIFANYTDRLIHGHFLRNPILLGTNSNEAGFYVMRYAGHDNITLTQQQQNEIGFGLFTCPVVEDATIRSAFLKDDKDTPVYRYEYFGDWPNLELYPGSGAYHTAETSMVFGTMADLSGAANTKIQEEVSQYMQKVWTTFAKDPVHGLSNLGWPRFDAHQPTLARLGFGNETKASFVSADQYDQLCLEL